MPRYKVVTLVDITRTNAGRTETDKYKLSQQANFNSLLQAIGLRSNVSWIHDPEKHTGRLPEPADGKSTYWVWEFDAEREDVFLKDNDPVGLLKDDLHGVPIIVHLDDTADIDPAAFQTRNDGQNTWLTII